MAKTSKIVSGQKRDLLIKKYRKLRQELKAVICSLHASDEERLDAELRLQKLPRDSSPSRARHRCRLCGRSRAYNRLTGLCRIHMRHAVMNGLVPGMRKASW